MKKQSSKARWDITGSSSGQDVAELPTVADVCARQSGVGEGEASAALFRGTERFRVIQQLGTGGMGAVYEVHDLERDERVALKTLLNLDAQALYRLKNEFRALQGIEHPHLIHLHELFHNSDEWFFTMDLIRGRDLSTHVRLDARADVTTRPTTETYQFNDIVAEKPEKARPPDAALVDTVQTIPGTPGALEASTGQSDGGDEFDEFELRSCLQQLALGLFTLHEAGKIHRDVKPSNVLVTPDGHVTLLDFGLTTDVTRHQQSLDSRVAGTPAYMAPEQAGTEAVGPATDWYSVGILLYEILAGRRPFVGSPWQILVDKQLREPPPPRTYRDNIPADLDLLCIDLLRRDPDARPSGREVLERLGVSSSEQTVGKSRPHSSQDRFVGRETELAVLRDAFDKTRRGNPAAVYIHGASGVGKSALLHAFAKQAPAADEAAVVLAGRCYESEDVPYKAFDHVVDELSRYLWSLPETEAALLIPRHAALLPRVFPVLGRIEAIARAPRPLREIKDPRQLRTRAFAALRELLFLLAERRRVIVLMDDWQWSDTDSLMLLCQLMRPPEAPPLLWLLGSREPFQAGLTQRCGSSPCADKASAESMQVLNQIEIVALDPLDPASARILAENLLEQAGLDATASAEIIASEAGGHPLYINELVHHAAMSGTPSQASPLLDDVIWSRVSRLPPPAGQILQLVATAGTRLPQGIIRTAARSNAAEFATHVSRLRASQLVRTGGLRDGDPVEPYHDRVRESLLERLDPATRTDCHRRLAMALENDECAKEYVELLFRHWAAAGNACKAANYALEAAQQSARTLAFERAAEFYGRAIELGTLTGDKLQQAQLELGNSLAIAGRGPEAAAAHMNAAEDADPATRRDYQRRAALQLLISGRHDEGLDIVRPLLADLGISLPEKPRQAIASLWWQRFKLALRGYRWTERHESEIAASDLARLDLLRAVGEGLANSDPLCSAVFASRSLLVALQLGEPQRVARALGLECVLLIARGGRAARRGQKWSKRALALLDNLDGTEHATTASLIRGYIALVTGDYAAAASSFRECAVTCRDVRCSGPIDGRLNGLTTSRLFLVLALRELGEFREWQECAPTFLRDAAHRGDLWFETTMRRACIPLFLMRDQPDEALRDLRRTSWVRPEGRYHFQHWQELRARVEVQLYTGMTPEFVEEFQPRFRQFQRSMLFRMARFAAIYHELRGRVALTLSYHPEHRPRGLRDAARAARQLEREPHDYARAWGLLLRAGIAARRDQPERAAAQLADAASLAESKSMRFHAALARRRRGELIGGDEGRALIAAADEWMTRQGIVDIEKMTATFAPGFDRDRKS